MKNMFIIDYLQFQIIFCPNGSVQIAASPNEEYFHDYTKGCTTFYMPAWSWEELKQFHEMKVPLNSKIDLPELRRRFDKFGGLIRIMTYNKAHLMNYENSITEAIYAVANNISELKNLSRGILRNCNKMKQIGNIFSG